MSIQSRTARSEAKRRPYSGRTLVALVAAAALTLGPGAMSAFADDAVPPEATVTTEVTLAAPAPESPAPPPPEPPAPEPELPLPAPAPAPPAPEPPAPAPEAPAPEEPSAEVPSDAPAEAEELAPEESLPAEQPEPADETDVADAAKDKDDSSSDPMVKICHATGSEKNPWQLITLNATGVISGHAAQHETDIIPPFEYKEPGKDGKKVSFPGKNLTPGNMAIWENNCEELPPPPPPSEMIKICHATNSEKNPWSMLLLEANAIINGHAKHERDIIPAFEYEKHEQTLSFPGQNLTPENVAIWENDCNELSPVTLNPVVMVTVEQCLVPDGVIPSTVGISISNLVNKYKYTLVVTGPNGFVSETPVTHTDGTAYIDQAIPGPGDYIATVTGEKGKGGGDDHSTSEGHSKDTVSGMQAFTVNDCPAPPPPAPPASVTPVVTITPVVPAVPTTSAAPMQALAVTGTPDNGSGLAAGILLLLGAGSALLATGARRALKLRG